MRLGNSRQSRNVEDRRGRRMRIGGRGKFGIGTIILALVAAYFGIDPSFLLQDTGNQGMSMQQTGTPPAPTPESQFASKVLADTEDTWESLFQSGGLGTYQAPTLVLFTDMTPTACGTGQSAMGPFYCPADGKIYLDLSFFQELSTSLTPGRLRTGLCHRARSGPPRAKPSWRNGSGEPTSRPGGSDHCQST